MNTSTLAVESRSVGSARASVAVLWIAQFAVAGILGMGAFTKFFMYTPEGSMALADALGVGRGVILSIGSIELAAAILILIPRRHILGAILAAATMGGALFAHATRIGWSGNSASEMWPLALVGFVAAASVVVFHYRRNG